MKKKWSAGKIAALICGCIAAAFVLIVAFYISVFQLTRNIIRINADNDNYQAHAHNDNKAGENPKDWFDDYDEDDFYDYYKDNTSEYYDFHDDIREDLSYWVEFEDYDEVIGDNKNISFSIESPIFYAEETVEMTGVNNAVQKEIVEVHKYLESVAEWIGKDEEFSFEVESYVTYMDEELLSIVYVEYGYLDDSFYESYVISVNIDMESKMALTNTQLLDIDDDFSIDFRNRCEKQNGEIESLYYYSDQEITEMLTSEDSLIIFYTPLGMEVGFNYYYGWVTVTYPDYQKYQRKF